MRQSHSAAGAIQAAPGQETAPGRHPYPPMQRQGMRPALLGAQRTRSQENTDTEKQLKASHLRTNYLFTTMLNPAIALSGATDILPASAPASTPLSLTATLRTSESGEKSTIPSILTVLLLSSPQIRKSCRFVNTKSSPNRAVPEASTAASIRISPPRSWSATRRPWPEATTL